MSGARASYVNPDTYMVVHFKISSDETSGVKTSTPITVRAYRDELAYLDKEPASPENSSTVMCVNGNAPADIATIKAFFNTDSKLKTLFNTAPPELQSRFLTEYTEYVNAFKNHRSVSGSNQENMMIAEAILKLTVSSPQPSPNWISNWTNSLKNIVMSTFTHTPPKNATPGFSFLISNLHEYSNSSENSPKLFIANLVCATYLLKWLVGKSTTSFNPTNPDTALLADYKAFCKNNSIVDATTSFVPDKIGVRTVEAANAVLGSAPATTGTTSGGRARHTARRNHRAFRRTMKHAFTD